MRIPCGVPFCIVLVSSLALSTAGAGRPQDKAGLSDTMFASVSNRPVVPIRAFPFSLKSVRLLDGPFKHGHGARPRATC